jgi:hypothetical protein
VLSCASGQLNLNRENFVPTLGTFSLAQDRLCRIPAGPIHIKPLVIALAATHQMTVFVW